MVRKLFFSFLTGFFLLEFNSSLAQSLPLSVPLAREMVQRGQLSGVIPVKRSGNLWPAAYRSMFSFDLGLNMDTVKNKFFAITLLPIVSKQRYTSHHPDGMNDGIMIPAKGFQTFWSGGIFLKAGPLEIQAMPEFVRAQNSAFEGEDSSNGIEGAVDIPNRFGKEPYETQDWGQSSIKLAVGPIAFGVSNENVWWGPGRNNAIMMSNNAPGFLHATFLTRKPLVTPIGNFEFQVIGGYIKPSGFSNKSVNRVYLNSGILSFQPKILPGLSGGIIRSFMQEDKKYDTWRGYLPVLSGISKVSLGGTAEDLINRNQLLSVFARYLLPKSQAEFYFEFGKEDHNWDLRDIILEYAHSRVYLMGFRKLIPLANQKGAFIQLSAEISHLIKPLMTANRNNNLFTGGDFYQYGGLSIGYTHAGQYLGAGIGTGGSQTLFEVSWIKGMKRIGITADRRVHEGDYSNAKWPGNTQFRWVDLSLTPVIDWDFNRFLIHFTARNVRSLNYRHKYIPRLDKNGEDTFKGKGIYNLLAELQVAYFLSKPSKN